MSAESKKQEIQDHLIAQGFRFGLTAAEVDDELERVIGEKRFKAYLKRVSQRNRGVADNSVLYLYMKTAEEANTLFSHQSQILLENSAWLASKVKEFIKPTSRIGELGCAAGALVAWLAMEHPDTQVIGFDCIKPFIKSAKDAVQQPNASFEVWDYSNPLPPQVEPCDLLVSSFGIDFMGGASDSSSSDVGQESSRRGVVSRFYQRQVAPFFSSWRSAIKDGGHLFAVLRISSFPQFLGVVDAAYAAGWSFDFQHSIKHLADNKTFPAVCFVAEPGEVPREDDLLAYWISDQIGKAFPAAVGGEMALAMFQLLKNKEVLGSEEKYDGWSGITTHVTRGRCGPFGYLYERSNAGDTLLQIVPATRLDQLVALSFIDKEW